MTHVEREGGELHAEREALLRRLAELDGALGSRDGEGRLARAIEASEARLQRVLSEIAAAVVTFELGGAGSVYVSPSTQEILGLAPADVLAGPQVIFDLVHPDDRGREDEVRRRLEEQGTAEWEHRILRPDGSLRWVSTRLRLLRDPAGVPVRIDALVIDVTERRREDEARARRDRRFRRLIEHGGDIISLMSPDGQVEYVSESVVQVRGYTPEEVMAVPLAEQIHPDDLQRALASLVTLAGRPGASDSVEARLRHRDGRWIWMELGGQNLLGDPDVQALVISTRDIDVRKRAEAALAASEEKLRQILGGLWDAITVFDADLKIVFAGGNIAGTYGHEPEEMVGRAVLDFVHLDDQGQRARLERDVLAVPFGRATFEARVRHKSGAYVWMEVGCVNLFDDPAVRGVLSTARVISDRKRWEGELRSMNAELEQRVAERTAALQDLYDHAPCGYFSLDRAGVLTRINATALGWVGYAEEEVLGRPLLDFLTPESARVAAAEMERAYAEPGCPGIPDVEREIRRKDGSTFWVLANMLFDRDPEGRITGSRATSVDVTERRRADALLREQDARLRAALDEAAAASQAKDEFLASMSHELRTPLNGILGLGEALREGVYGPLDPRQAAPLGRIEESGQHLLALISDILDLAKVEAGKLTLEVGPVVVADLVSAALRLVQSSAQRKDLRVQVSQRGFISPAVLDERRIKQVFVNLLSNAVKFTPEGGTLGIDTAESADGTLTVTVWDTGIGIAAGDLGRLFRPFVQLDSRLSRRHTGTGLGLALVRRIVELHGGAVGVESEPGHGARFTVTLPRRPAPR